MAGGRIEIITESSFIPRPARATQEQMETYHSLRFRGTSPQKCVELLMALNEVITAELDSFRGSPNKPSVLCQIKSVAESTASAFLDLRESARAEVAAWSRIGGRDSILVKFTYPPELVKLCDTPWDAQVTDLEKIKISTSLSDGDES